MSASRSSSDFLVYACTSCGKRIFTDRAHQGRRGVCPVCGAAHEIGARDPSLAAEKGEERRRSRRMRAKDGRVGLSGPRARPGNLLGPADLYELQDLSATGVGFLVPGVADPRHLSGERPPAIKPGDQLLLTLHLPQLAAPRTLEAEVRRVAKHRRLWLVGAQFQFTSPDEQAELAALVAQLA